MKKLALLTPWPPQQSGIADYAFDLAKALSGQELNVVVYTSETQPSPLAGVRIVSVNDTTDFRPLADFDYRVYQLGNNTTFHLWMIPLLQQYPGVIHLHDLVMHHMAAWLTWMRGDVAAYLALLQKWYGPRGRQIGERALEQEDCLWNSDRVAEFPLCEEYLQDAEAIVVHSEYALRHVRNTVAHVPSFQLEQLYDIAPRTNSSDSIRNISVLGGVDPQKRLDWVIGALGQIRDRLPDSRPVRLQVVGGVDPKCEYLREAAEEACGPGIEIVFLGRVDEHEFNRIFTTTDLCIALRYPTMGETSAIVSKALQFGVPTIVNDIGWYSELPEHIIKKLPVRDCQSALEVLLEYLLLDEPAYSEWSKRCLAFANTEFSLEDYADHYLEICDNPDGVELLTDIYASVLTECGLAGTEEEDLLLGKILDQSYF